MGGGEGGGLAQRNICRHEVLMAQTMRRAWCLGSIIYIILGFQFFQVSTQVKQTELKIEIPENH